MKALLVLVLFATTASADDDTTGRVAELRSRLTREVEHRRGVECLAILDELDAAGVPASTTFPEWHGLRRNTGARSFSDVRTICIRIEDHKKVRDMQSVIVKALRFPWAWAGRCVDHWPEALAAGLKPRAHVEIRTSSRRGIIVFSGTIEAAYLAYCEHAYTPARRPHR